MCIANGLYVMHGDEFIIAGTDKLINHLFPLREEEAAAAANFIHRYIESGGMYRLIYTSGFVVLILFFDDAAAGAPTNIYRIGPSIYFAKPRPFISLIFFISGSLETETDMMDDFAADLSGETPPGHCAFFYFCFCFFPWLINPAASTSPRRPHTVDVGEKKGVFYMYKLTGKSLGGIY